MLIHAPAAAPAPLLAPSYCLLANLSLSTDAVYFGGLLPKFLKNLSTSSLGALKMVRLEVLTLMP
jgi:hypothetical protein